MNAQDHTDNENAIEGESNYKPADKPVKPNQDVEGQGEASVQNGDNDRQDNS
jgi:hypothetical protein